MLEAYAAHADAFTSSVEERAPLPLAWWADRLQPGDEVSDEVLGAFDGDRLVGAAGLHVENRPKLRHKGILFGMVVVPEARGRGVGEGLVAAVLERARARGLRAVGLTVTEGNEAAQRLYARCGFVAFGTEPLAIAHEGRFLGKVHMTYDLGACDLGT